VRDEPPRAWVLNLDAEDELARGQIYRLPSLAKRAEYAARGLCSGLVRQGDVVLDATLGVRDDRRARGLRGAAFMPTPRALRRLAEAGCVVPPAPSLEVLRRANERSLLPPRLPGAIFARTLEEALAALERPTSGHFWLCKRALGAAGRGHRRVAAGRVRDADLAWLDAALRKTGGVEVSPWLDRVADFALHGLLARDGSLIVGAPTLQEIDASDAWRASRLAGPEELGDDERAALCSALDEAAAALRMIAYFGPFGIDAFRYRANDEQMAFCARCDLNARYTMGYSVGLGVRAR
jgi:hypothetical protein